MAPQQSTASQPRVSSPANNSQLTTAGAADNDEVSHRKQLEDLGYGVESFNTILRPGKTSGKLESCEYSRIPRIPLSLCSFLFLYVSLSLFSVY